jgi:hypothetical protein
MASLSADGLHLYVSSRSGGRAGKHGRRRHAM